MHQVPHPAETGFGEPALELPGRLFRSVEPDPADDAGGGQLSSGLLRREASIERPLLRAEPTVAARVEVPQMQMDIHTESHAGTSDRRRCSSHSASGTGRFILPMVCPICGFEAPTTTVRTAWWSWTASRPDVRSCHAMVSSTLHAGLQEEFDDGNCHLRTLDGQLQCQRTGRLCALGRADGLPVRAKLKHGDFGSVIE
jgi:hypothetical protein